MRAGPRVALDQSRLIGQEASPVPWEALTARGDTQEGFSRLLRGRLAQLRNGSYWPIADIRK